MRPADAPGTGARPFPRPFSRAVRGAARTAIVGLIVVDLLAAVSVFAVAGSTLRAELDAAIGDEIAFMEEVERGGGEDDLIALVAGTAMSGPRPFTVTGLFRPDGTWVAGNLRALPPFWDRGRFRDDPAGAGRPSVYYGRVVRAGDLLIVVGHSAGALRWTDRVLLPLLLLTSVAGVALIAGLARRADRRLGADLRRIGGALDAYVAGDERARVPLDPRGGDDSLQAIGRGVNANLDRLSDALATLRGTTAAVAHDLRRPLVRASLAVQAAAATPGLPAAAADRIAQAGRELDALNDTFEAILRITAIAHGSREGFGPVDLAELLGEMVETFEPVLEDAGGRLEADLLPEPLVVHGDRAMLAQAFVNLIGNALRHAPPGTTVRLAAGRNGSPWAEVADDGPGVPPEALEAIFRPFERLDPSRGMDGAGLGLALVAATARAHGATVAARDNGPGLVVRLAFPIP